MLKKIENRSQRPWQDKHQIRYMFRYLFQFFPSCIKIIYSSLHYLLFIVQLYMYLSESILVFRAVFWLRSWCSIPVLFKSWYTHPDDDHTVTVSVQVGIVYIPFRWDFTWRNTIMITWFSSFYFKRIWFESTWNKLFGFLLYLKWHKYILY